MFHVIFVCTGNTCRSPMAAGLFRLYLQNMGLQDCAKVESAGLAAAAGAVGMGIAVAKTSEATARQPEAEGKIRSSLMLGLVFIETAIIYALIVAILIIFVL